MAQQKSERARLMVNSFMELREKGLSIQEIAEKFNLNVSTVYRYLQEIADANGVTREDLLTQVHSGYLRGVDPQTKKETLEFEDLKASYQELLNVITEKVEALRK